MIEWKGVNFSWNNSGFLWLSWSEVPCVTLDTISRMKHGKILPPTGPSSSRQDFQTLDRLALLGEVLVPFQLVQVVTTVVKMKPRVKLGKSLLPHTYRNDRWNTIKLRKQTKKDKWPHNKINILGALECCRNAWVSSVGAAVSEVFLSCHLPNSVSLNTTL